MHNNNVTTVGNLIALPLHGGCRQRDTTVFCNPATWRPYPDQFAHLSRTRRLTPSQLQDLVDTLGPVNAGPSATMPAMPARPRRGQLGRAPATVSGRMAAMLEIDTAGLPPQLIAALKHAASFHNPEFYRKQNQRFSTFNTPRMVCCFDASDPARITLPRGLHDEAAALIAAAGGRLELSSDFPDHTSITAGFTGELTPTQAAAADTMATQAGLPYSSGVLVAPAGSGKTVIACAVVARHAQPTAIIVNRAELAVQWRERLATFLDLGDAAVGSLGQGKDRRGHLVDVIMLQSLSHRNAPDGLLEGYSLIVVDECHAIGAPAAEAAIRKVNAPHWLGLSATPYRADQMDALITMQCGPIRHEIPDLSTFAKHLIIHHTDFTTDEPGTDGASIQAIYGELAADDARTAHIAADIAEATLRGRCSLALTNRLEHVERIAIALKAHDIDPLILHGGLAPTERGRVRAILSSDSDGPLVLLAIDKVAGEGFDAPRLDTVFLASPISFKGRVIQQVGRIMRNTEAKKTHVEAHDYLDAQVPLLDRMHHKRRRILQRHGFLIGPRAPQADSAFTVDPPATSTGREHTSPFCSPALTKPQPQADAPREPTVAEVRAWAREHNMDVPTRGKLRAEIWTAWRAAHS